MPGSARTYGALVYGFAVVVGTGTLPTGLWTDYAEAFDFSPAVLTALAGSPAIGVIIAVVGFGPVSDLIGRRPVLVAALVLAAASLLALLVANGVLMLLAARILTGLAVGLYTGAGTAALTELAPAGQTRRAATHAVTASIVGFAIGPLVGGLFVEYGPWPLRLVYAVSLLLLVPPFVAVLRMDETMTRRAPFAFRLQRLGVTRAGRPTFGLASLVALCAFATTSFFQSLGPTIVIKDLGVANRAVAVGVVGCFLGTSSVAQMRFRGMPIRRQTVLGLTLLPAGIALVAAGLVGDSVSLFVAGALVGGLGQGLAYLGGQSLVERVAPTGQRSETFSAYLVVVYVSGGVTALSLGIAAKAYGIHPAAVTYAIVVGAVTLGTAALAARAIRGPARVEADAVAPPL